MLTGSGKKDGRFGTAIAALGDINLDHYNGIQSVFLCSLTSVLRASVQLGLRITVLHLMEVVQCF